MLSRVSHQIGNLPKNIYNAPKKVTKTIANTYDDMMKDHPAISNLGAIVYRKGGKRKTRKTKKSNRKTRKTRK